MSSLLRQLFRIRANISDTPTVPIVPTVPTVPIVPKARVIEPLVEQRNPINVVEEQELLSEVEELNEDIIGISEYRNNNREMDSKLLEIYESYITASESDSLVNELVNILKELELAVNKFLQNNILQEHPDFIRTVLKNVDIVSAQYLTIKEIALFLFYLYIVLENIFNYDTYSEKSLKNTYSNYKSLIKLYEVVFEDIYYTFDIDYSIYNSLMKEMDKELTYRLENIPHQSLDEKKNLISAIYLKFLIYCLLYTPLNKMGNYDNTIAFFKNYLAYLTIIIPDKDGYYKRTRHFFAVKSYLLPSSWLVN